MSEPANLFHRAGIGWMSRAGLLLTVPESGGSPLTLAKSTRRRW